MIGNKKIKAPKLVVPIPVAIRRIETLLNEDRWRLVDFFKDLDKNKDWKLCKNDFVREHKKGRLDVTDEMTDELITVYGNSRNTLNYKSLAKGRTDHLLESRLNVKGSIEILF